MQSACPTGASARGAIDKCFPPSPPCASPMPRCRRNPPFWSPRGRVTALWCRHPHTHTKMSSVALAGHSAPLWVVQWGQLTSVNVWQLQTPQSAHITRSCTTQTCTSKHTPYKACARHDAVGRSHLRVCHPKQSGPPGGCMRPQ